MTFAELTLEIVRELIKRSGVREWEDQEARQAITMAAMEMASNILSNEVAFSMSNEAYVNHGTAVVFGSEAGDNVAWSTEGIADGAGRQATLYDQGAEGTARPLYWQYRIYCQAQATPTVGNELEVYLKTSDGSHPDNDDGGTDAAVSAEDKLKNLIRLRSPIVDQAAGNIEFVAHGIIEIPERYFAPVLWNSMGAATTADAAETKAVFTPIYMQTQA